MEISKNIEHLSKNINQPDLVDTDRTFVPSKYTYQDYFLGHRTCICFYMNTDANILNKMSANQILYTHTHTHTHTHIKTK